MTKSPAFWKYSCWLGHTIRCRNGSALVANACRDLIFAQFLLETDDAEIEDRYGIDEGLGLILRVAVFEPCEPVAREGVVHAGSSRPTHARAVPADRDASKGIEVSIDANAAPPVT